MKDQKSIVIAVGVLGSVLGLVQVATSQVAHAGGTIVGKVTYNGKSEEKEFLFSKFPNSKFCSKNPHQDLAKGDKRIMPTIRVGSGGGLQAAVVTVRDIENQVSGFKGTDHIAEFCEWLPFTGVVVKKKDFRVENHDADPDDPGPKGDFLSKNGVLHNPHAFEQLGPSSTTIFNIALATEDSKLNKHVVLRKDTQGSMFRLQCDQHEFMQSFFIPVTNPYYVVAKDDGSFEIKDVPTGKHKIMAWHPFAGRVETEADVPEGGRVETKLEIKNK